jgi:4-amino-4-deoxy-L-arabinose transferase-like glycosyltransferase
MLRAALLALPCAAVLFAGLNTVGFLDVREAHDAAVARELIRRHELLTPVLGGEPQFQKPILGYVVDAAGAALRPEAPVAARALKATLALALVILTGALGARHFGPRAGWCAAGVMATSLGLPLAARTDGTQLLATLLGWTGCAGLADALFGRSAGRELRLVVAWGALAATLVVAGPLPALWPVAALALYAALVRSRAGWSAARPGVGLAILIGLALPWYGAMAERHGADFLGRVPFFPYGLEPRRVWYAGLVSAPAFLVVCAFPWSALLPGAALHAATLWRRFRRPRPGAQPIETRALDAAMARERSEESAAHFFVACLGAALVPVVFYPSSPFPAALPALPAAALLCGRLLDHLLEDPARIASPLSYATGMVAVIGSGGAILLSLMASRMRDADPDLRLVAVALLVTTWGPFLANFIARRRAAAMLLALPVALGAPLTTTRLLPAMEGWLSARAAAAAMEAVAPPGAVLVLVEPPPPSLRIYSRRNLVVGAATLRAALESNRASDGLAYAAFRPLREREVAHAAPGPIEIVARTPALVLARIHPAQPAAGR